ncbi:hypothetical protein pdam_00024255, partial [Pocillopora damicornis]
MEPLNAEVDEWEVAVNRVLLQDVIGRGAFGAVWRALLSSPNGQPGNRTVAAKCFTPTAGEDGRKCLMREIELARRLPNSLTSAMAELTMSIKAELEPVERSTYVSMEQIEGGLRVKHLAATVRFPGCPFGELRRALHTAPNAPRPMTSCSRTRFTATSHSSTSAFNGSI